MLDLHSANRTRSLQRFEDALNEYDRIIASYPDCFEAYWGATLSDYGVQYEKDYDGKMLPTMHRFSEIPVFENKYFKNATKYCKNESELARIKKSAENIENIRIDIKKTVGTQAPYDIFLCYKETPIDGNGLTPEYYWASELYINLRSKGYNVFFAKESLPATKGHYEAHIFPALKSARLMLILTSSIANIESVWVKNEWSRFIRFAKENPSDGKRFKVIQSGFKPEQLPHELRNEQVLNHNSLSWIEQLNDILKATFPKANNSLEKSVLPQEQSDINVTPLLKRVFAFLAEGDFKSADEYCERVLDIELENAEAYLGKLMVDLYIKKREDLKNCEKPFIDNINYKFAIRYGNETLRKEFQEYITHINQQREEKCKEAEHQKELARIEGQRRLKQIKKITFISTPIVCVILAFVIIFNVVIMPATQYNKANSLMNDKKYTDAIAMFVALNGYKDSKEKIEACNTAILDTKYNKAQSLMNAKKYTEAISIFEKLGEYKDTENKIIECKKAIFISEYGQEAYDRYGLVEVGQYISFGEYEQDNNIDNGKESINWLVLDIQNGKALLLSQYALVYKPYNVNVSDNIFETKSTTWKTCSLRSWLNNTFIKNAFTQDEQTLIPTVTVSADKTPNFANVDPGKDTQDKVFLLSVLEARKYSGKKFDTCIPTEYAKNKAETTSSTCRWWLRSPGAGTDFAAYAYGNGNGVIYGYGSHPYTLDNMVDSYDFGVRPAMWINLNM